MAKIYFEPLVLSSERPHLPMARADRTTPQAKTTMDPASSGPNVSRWVALRKSVATYVEKSEKTLVPYLIPLPEPELTPRFTMATMSSRDATAKVDTARPTGPAYPRYIRKAIT
jgi:hypothetical protein